jgi:2-hydroxy-6-oxonona-2,4-dienedioate hydrolase
MRISCKICVTVGGLARGKPSGLLLMMGVAAVLLLSIFDASPARAELTTNGEVAGLRAQFIDVSGIRTRYYEMGEGAPMVLVHGGGWSGHSSANIWSKNIPLFANRFHVFAPDKLGSGMTENPKDDNELNIQGEVDHIYDFIRTMKLGMVHLVGESRGGACVLFLALQHPEVIRALVIVDSNSAAPEGSGSSARGDPSATCLKEPEWEAWKCRMRSRGDLPDEAFDDEYFMAGKYMALLPKSQETVARLKAGAGGELATAHGFNQWKTEWYERIGKEGVLQMPVLLYWGNNDAAATIATGRAMYEIIAKQNPRVKLVIEDNAGHFPFRENPEDFVAKVTDFIDHPSDAQISANPSK